MTIDHEMLTGFSKSFGLFYLIAMSIGVLVYAYWPSNKKPFEQAAASGGIRRRGQAMSVGERDPFTGHQTTGHEWNGIKELNTPVPRPVYFFLITMGVFALVWTLLMPSWPYGIGYFKGLLGVDQKQAVAKSIAEAAAERAGWMARIEKEDLAQIQSDPDLMRTVREDGRTLFGDNCAACHGANAKGNKGFPNIAQSPMLWGDDPQTVLQTVTVGINGTDPNTRVSQMLAFGRDGMLTQDQVSLLAGFVQVAFRSRHGHRQKQGRYCEGKRRSSPPIASPVMATTPKGWSRSVLRT